MTKQIMVKLNIDIFKNSHILKLLTIKFIAPNKEG
jgi:hypothetical protein